LKRNNCCSIYITGHRYRRKWRLLYAGDLY